MEPTDPWTAPHWNSSALVVIDVQRDFVSGGSMPVPGTDEVLPTLRRLVSAFRAAGRPVVHVVRLYRADAADVDLVRRGAVADGLRVVVPGTAGSELLPTVLGERLAALDSALLLSGEPQPLGPDEFALFKPRWSAFHRTGLERLLRERHAVDTVVVAGCNLPNCPRATLFDASQRDLRAVLVTDAVSQTSEERLADLPRIGVRLATTEDVVTALAGTRRIGLSAP